MRTNLFVGSVFLMVSLGGCMIVESPIRGMLGTEVTWGEVATAEPSSPALTKTKEGTACAQSILGLLAHGDASVRQAKVNGGITEVTSVDHSARNLLNIVGEWCTIVRGH